MKVSTVKLWDDSSGATAIEYGLIAALIAVGILVGLSAYGDALRVWYENIEEAVSNA
jgi:pilus assembly protein Flp/PilA